MIPPDCTDAKLERLAERVGRRLLATRRHVATAESCTGGWIAKALTDVPGSSAWFLEGFVTYSNRAKIEHLEVPRTVLERHGAVSRAVVRAMAGGALQRAAAELAVAVTGIAGPDGAVPGKPVGTVWFCWAERKQSRGSGLESGSGSRAGAGSRGAIRLYSEVRHFRGDREAVRRKTVRHALRGLFMRGT